MPQPGVFALEAPDATRRIPPAAARVLSDRWGVLQIQPRGYGYSERVVGYAGEALANQVTAVLDHHGVDRFVVWGYSKGGAMAACIARGTTRTAGPVCGAYSLLDHPTDASLRQMDRRLRADHPGRTLWAWVKRFEWRKEFREMPCPSLLYWGSEDRHAPGRRRARDLLLQMKAEPDSGPDRDGRPTRTCLAHPSRFAASRVAARGSFEGCAPTAREVQHLREGVSFRMLRSSRSEARRQTFEPYQGCALTD